MTSDGRHSSVPLQQGIRQSSVNKRRSNGRACLTCHQRKVRCDILTKGSPCSNCETQGKSSCRIYEKKKPKAVQVHQSRRIVPIQPRGHQQRIATSPKTPGAANTRWTDSPRTRSSHVDESPSLEHEIRGQGHAYQLRGRHSESEPAAFGDYECLDEQETRNLVDLIDEKTSKPTEIGSNHRLYFIGTEFSNINYLIRQRSQNVDLNQLHFGSYHHARELHHIPAEALELPEKPVVEELIQAYFTRVNRGWPIIDEVDFMTRYKSTDPTNSVPLALLHAVLLVGAHVLASPHNDYRSLKSHCFRQAKLLIDSRFEEDRKVYVQVPLLLTCHCDNLEDIVSNSWYWIGFATRTALGLGMHRDASKSSMSAIHKREWVRLWWVLFQLDVLVSTAYGRPQALRLDESDTPTLQECHFEGIPGANIAFVIEHTRLCVISSNAMRRILALRATPTEKTEARRQADQSLAQFITQLPECLRLPQPEADNWQSFLHLTYNNFLILLHRSSAKPTSHSLHTPQALSDLNICGDAVVVITSIYEFVRARSATSELPIQSLYPLFTALVHVSSELTSANPLVEAKSKRMLHSLLLSLREFSYFWIYARSLLRLFQWDSRRGQDHRKPEHPSTMDLGNDQTNVSHGEGLEHSMDYAPMAVSNVINSNTTESPNNLMFTPSSTAQRSTYDDQNNSAIETEFVSESRSRDNLQGNSYYIGTDISNLDIPTEGLDMMPFPSALDFLLAGLGDDFDGF
ncbi:fungal-specific transcription factor domain-containing protein [Penicillium angulare]|uniref:Fungal-specific transcription factor domain-containing protein n=1 Tax=Penicillium angulare TaxID=116970 RepID=A0A9W9K187_9EURO|nr:fungal-specific transcription factor domain-containing protein [Penicillium angulare]